MMNNPLARSYFPLVHTVPNPEGGPILHVDWPRVQRLRPSTMLTAKLPAYVLLPEASQIIEAAKDTPSRIFYMLLWLTGARLSEVHLLTKGNFQLSHPDLPHVLVPTLKQRHGKSLYTLLREKKKRQEIRSAIRRQPVRMIGITETVYLTELRRYLNDLGGRDSDFIFKPERTNTLATWLARDIAALPLDIHVTPKAFRHGFGVCATLQGIPTAALKELMGHSDIANTEIYTRVMQGHYAHMTQYMAFV